MIGAGSCQRKGGGFVYEIIDRALPGTIGIRIAGDIQESEFVALRAEIAAILEKSAPLNVVFECCEGVEVKPAVLWDDMKFVESRAGQFGRMALIATDQWAPMAEIVSDSGFEARHFLPAETDAAWRWACGE